MDSFSYAIRRFWHNAFKTNARATRADVYWSLLLVVIWELLFKAIEIVLTKIHLVSIAPLVMLIATIVIMVPFITSLIRRLVDEGCTVLGATCILIGFILVSWLLVHFLRVTMITLLVIAALFILMTIFNADAWMISSEVEIMKKLFRSSTMMGNQPEE